MSVYVNQKDKIVSGIIRSGLTIEHFEKGQPDVEATGIVISYHSNDALMVHFCESKWITATTPSNKENPLEEYTPIVRFICPVPAPERNKEKSVNIKGWMRIDQKTRTLYLTVNTFKDSQESTSPSNIRVEDPELVEVAA